MLHRIPKQQGDEDGLCGIYAILNAIGYLYPNMDEDHLAAIFKTVAKSLTWWPDVIWSGTGTKEVHLMLNAIMSPGIIVSMPFSRMHHMSFKNFFDQLYSIVKPEHQVAIIGLEKPYEHWTVAKTVTGASILLQDSCQIHQIKREHSGLPGSGAQWQIDPACTFLIAKG